MCFSFSRRGTSAIYDNRFDPICVCVQRTFALTSGVGKGKKAGERKGGEKDRQNVRKLRTSSASQPLNRGWP